MAVKRDSEFDYRGRPTVATVTEPHLAAIYFSAFNEMRQLKMFCDVELAVRDARFVGHKVILGAGSPYLMKLFNETSHGYVEIFDGKINTYSVNLLIEYLYTFTICISESTVLDLCYAAQVLRMGKIQKYCCKFLKKSLWHSNVIPYLFFCVEHNYNSLVLHCIEYALNNLHKIYIHDTFRELTQDDITKLIDILQIRDTSMEYDVLYNWAKHDMTQRRGILHLLLLVSFPCNPPPPTRPNSPLISLTSSDLSTLPHAPRLHRQPEQHAQTKPVNSEELTQKLIKIKHSTTTLFAIGGTTNDSVTDTGEKFIIANDQRWTPIDKMPRKKSQSPAVMYDSNIYSIGGYNGRQRLACVDVYDPIADKWTPEGIPSLSFPRSGCTAVVLKEDLYVIGGYDGTNHIDCVEIFNFITHKWTQGPQLQVGRSYAQAAILNDAIYVVGGTNNKGRLKIVERLSADKEWEHVSLLNTPRSRPGLVSFRNNLYAIGGYDGQQHLSSMECYDVILNEWTIVAHASVPRNSPCACILEGCIYVIGGHNGRCVTKSVEINNPLKSNRWVEGVAMMTPRCDFALVVGLLPDEIDSKYFYHF